MEHTPDVDDLIACLGEADRENERAWLEKHTTQAGRDSLETDNVHVGVGAQKCVSYEPQIDLTVHTPDREPPKGYPIEDYETLAEMFVDTLLESTIGGVAFAPVTGCDKLFADKTDLPMYDSEIDDPYHMMWVNICMPPEAFLKIQYQQVYPSGDPDDPSFGDWLSQTSPEKTGVFQDAIESGSITTDEGFEIPRPFIALDKEFRLIDWQEGRHRGVAALQAGVDMMDVYVFFDSRSDRGKPEYKFAHPPMLPNKFD